MSPGDATIFLGIVVGCRALLFELAALHPATRPAFEPPFPCGRAHDAWIRPGYPCSFYHHWRDARGPGGRVNSRCPEMDGGWSSSAAPVVAKVPGRRASRG